MDVKEQIEKAVASITGDNKKIEAFKKDPIAAVKSVLGSSVGSDIINKVVEAVKAKLSADKISGAVNAIGGLFGKK